MMSQHSSGQSTTSYVYFLVFKWSAEVWNFIIIVVIIKKEDF